MMTITKSRSGARRLVALIVTGAAVVVSIAQPSVAVAETEPVSDPIATIVAARKQANEYAEEVFSVESELDALEVDEGRLVTEIKELEDEVAALQESAESIALDVYTGHTDPGIPVLTEGRAPLERITEDVLADFVNGDIDIDVDAYENAVSDLDASRDELVGLRTKADHRREDLEAALEAALDQIELLRELEAQYLADEASEDALEAAWAAENRSDEETKRDEQLAMERELVPSITADGSAGDSLAVQQNSENPDGAPAENEDPATAPSIADSFGYVEGQPPVDVNGDVRGGRTVNGSSLAGRTGLGGTGSDGEAPPPPAFVCPVGGPSSYADTWGAPRSGGRTHQGVDMIAPSGTPLVAVVSGRVVHRNNRLGGTTVTLYGDDGNRYYYAHLSRFEGGPRSVAQLDVIGYVGDTGNATGIPHLHFEIHPGGGVAVNPYQAVRGAGC